MVHGNPAGFVRLLAASVLAVSIHAAAASTDEGHVLLVRADAHRDHTWILASDGVYLHQHGARTAPRRFPLPGWMLAARALAGPPDLVVDEAGAVIVSSNVMPDLWRIDPATAAVVRFPVRLAQEADRDIGFTAIGLQPHGKVRAESATGSRWEVDLRDGTATRAAH